MNIFRFVLIIPCSLAIWYGCFFLGLTVLEIAVKQFCHNSSGLSCFDAGWDNIESILIAAFSSLSAFLIVYLSSVLAPYKKFETAVLVYIAGLIAASAIALTIMSEWWALIGASVFGAFSLLLVKTHNTSNQNIAT